jgi:hypothetical protein
VVVVIVFLRDATLPHRADIEDFIGVIAGDSNEDHTASEPVAIVVQGVLLKDRRSAVIVRQSLIEWKP